jgi:hypothetical protein
MDVENQPKPYWPLAVIFVLFLIIFLYGVVLILLISMS